MRAEHTCSCRVCFASWKVPRDGLEVEVKSDVLDLCGGNLDLTTKEPGPGYAEWKRVQC